MCTGGQLKFHFPVFFCDFCARTNHECAAKRTGRTARYQPITSVQRSPAAQLVITDKLVLRTCKVFITFVVRETQL